MSWISILFYCNDKLLWPSDLFNWFCSKALDSWMTTFKCLSWFCIENCLLNYQFVWNTVPLSYYFSNVFIDPINALFPVCCILSHSLLVWWKRCCKYVHYHFIHVSDLYHTSPLFVCFFQSKRQGITVLVPLVHFF